MATDCDENIRSINHIVQGEYSYGWRRGFFWGSVISTVWTVVSWILYLALR